MAQVPNTTTFCLTDVTAVVGGTCLSSAFSNANPSGFDPSYGGTCTCLLNFRNYTDVVWKCVDFNTFNCGGYYGYWYGSSCIVTNPAMDSGECFDAYFQIDLYTDIYEGSAAHACSTIYCNSYNICNFGVNGAGYSCQCYACVPIRNGDNVEVYIEASSENYQGVSATAYLSTVTPINGCYCMGNSCSIISVYAP